MNYTLEDVREWHDKIFELVLRYGLNPFSQDFDICDHEQMLSYMAYSGMPSHYPHWSYGKSFEKLKTLYNYGVSGLPYEMVINANPSIAYLMCDNSLLLQILTIAHVYGHNDFFRNNFTFRTTKPEYLVETFKTHADRVRRYVEDPGIGLEKVENIFDAAHALSLQCRRNFAFTKLTRKEQIEKIREKFQKNDDEDQRRGLKKRDEFDEAGFLAATQKNPLEPDEDILLFLADPYNNRHMDDWARDLLQIVNEEAQYFIPQIETKIMNEGWASFWHKKILESPELGLPQGMQMEFLVRHSQVLSPHPGGINPYHLGLTIWDDIVRRYDDALKGKITEEDEREYDENGWPGDLKKGKTGIEKIFEVREVDRDSSFLRRFLTEIIVRELGLFEHQQRGAETIVAKIADEDNWQGIKETLIKNVGTGTIPVIEVEDANYQNNRVLLLKHDYDGRDLQLEYAEKTLDYVHRLWPYDVALATMINEKKMLLYFTGHQFSIRPL